MRTKKPNEISRRELIQTSSVALLAGVAGIVPVWAQQNAPYNPQPAIRIGQPQEGADTPKLTLYMNDLLSEEEAIRLKQIGINWIDTQSVPEQPWGMDYLLPRGGCAQEARHEHRYSR